MMNLSRQTILFGLIAAGMLASIFLIGTKFLYPPLFGDKERVILMSVYNRTCGMTDPDDKSTFKEASPAVYCDVFLVSNHNYGRPSFDGKDLRFHPVQGRRQYVVMGEGHISWNSTDIEVKSSGITINGKPVKQGTKSVVIRGGGSFVVNGGMPY